MKTKLERMKEEEEEETWKSENIKRQATKSSLVHKSDLFNILGSLVTCTTYKSTSTHCVYVPKCSFNSKRKETTISAIFKAVDRFLIKNFCRKMVPLAGDSVWQGTSANVCNSFLISLEFNLSDRRYKDKSGFWMKSPLRRLFSNIKKFGLKTLLIKLSPQWRHQFRN